MPRPEITEHLAYEIAGRAHAGAATADLAAEFALAEWVIRLIVEAHPPDTCRAHEAAPRRSAPRSATHTDATDLARIARLLAQGLDLAAVAKAIDRPVATVARILEGNNFLGSKHALRKGERYVTEPTRCPICRAPLAIWPCRTCKIRALIAAGEKTWPDEKPAPQDAAGATQTTPADP